MAPVIGKVQNTLTHILERVRVFLLGSSYLIRRRVFMDRLCKFYLRKKVFSRGYKIYEEVYQYNLNNNKLVTRIEFLTNTSSLRETEIELSHEMNREIKL